MNGKAHKSSPTRSRPRRGREAVERIRGAIRDTLADDHPMTVRQVFYRLVSQGVIEKSEAEYKNTVCRLLADMRQEGEVPYEWVADNTRTVRKPLTFPSAEEALRFTAARYRRALWDDQTVYVEVWSEKDALAGVLVEETRAWDVPLMVSRGFASISYLYQAAQTLRRLEKPAHLFYLGDRDPSGVHIDRNIERQLRRLAPGAEIHFERLAVLPRQIEVWGLPTRPTKRSDSRAKDFAGDSVEVDAIPPAQLRALVRGRIEGLVDQEALRRVREQEQSERERLRHLAATGIGG
jgi:hypothetical protein